MHLCAGAIVQTPMRFSPALSLLLLSMPATFARAQGLPVYNDSLQNGFQAWGWAKVVDFKNAAPVHGGATSIRIVAGAWEAAQIHHSPLDSSPYSALSFWIHGGAFGGQKLRVQASLGDKIQDAAVVLEPLKPNEWTHVVVPLDQLGVAGKTNTSSFLIQNNSPELAPEFFLDDIAFLTPAEAAVALPAPVAAPAVAAPVTATPLSKSAPVDVQIDVSAARHPISPLLYGDSFAEGSHTSLRPTLNRWGGNSTSLYNWQLNADNKGNDYFFESIGSDNPSPGADADRFIETSRTLGAIPMITVPMTGWVAKLGPKREKLASYSVKKYGAQQKTDQWMADAGNSFKPDGKPVTGNDPNDAAMPVTPQFVTDWVKHLVDEWGGANGGGVRYYLLDNEPGLWSSSHRDVVPIAPTGALLRDTIIATAKAIRAGDPNAKIVGPEEWGWTGFLYSPADVQAAGASGNWNPNSLADRKAMGGRDFMPWLLSELYAEQKRSGIKMLDVFSLHIYPQEQGITISDRDFSDDAQRRRNRSTRILWDENYVDESWIKDKIALVPRMKKWANANYPGIQTGITEYSWSADDNIGGAIAQADALGIMGREGLDIATRWVAPIPGTVTFKACQLFRNYDGKNSAFGDSSVQTTAPNPDVLSAFGALRQGDGALTALVIHKELHQIAPLRLHIAHGSSTAKSAQHFQLGAENTLKRLPDVPIKNGLIAVDLAPQSINLFVVPKA